MLAVAAGTHQKTFGKSLGDIRHRSGTDGLRFLQTVGKGHGHIRTGISVRDREYVQGIDLLLVIGQVRLTAAQHVQQCRSIDQRTHHSITFTPWTKTLTARTFMLRAFSRVYFTFFWISFTTSEMLTP